jgi:hypothetical protein
VLRVELCRPGPELLCSGTVLRTRSLLQAQEEVLPEPFVPQARQLLPVFVL